MKVLNKIPNLDFAQFDNGLAACDARETERVEDQVRFKST